MVGFIHVLERVTLSNPYAIAAIILLLTLMALLGFTVAIECLDPEQRDWRYYRNISIRNHLWVLYFVLLFLFLCFAL